MARHDAHRLIALLFSVSLAVCEPSQAEECEKPLFQFGAIADCQYRNGTSERRKYDLSPQKLASCIEDFNQQSLAHVVHLGDFIDTGWESYDVVLPITERSIAPFYHVLGNHDFSVEERFKPQVPARLGLRDRYYDFAIGKWRFLILDTNDLSLYAYPKGSPEHEASLAYYEGLKGSPPSYNGGIGKRQLDWIEAKLKAAQGAGEQVILHSHHPVYPIERHAAWNAKEIVTLLERYSCVVAYINGHRHDGAYGFKSGIHFITLKGMVDTEETAYATVSVFENHIEVKGVGRQDDYVLEIPAR
ncbi:metallophosphoesterase [Pelagicoccus sp. SDUM812003]|uniref:metallophosphoesterase n=1 Tax=Pelagicoccus sp. SDUM812003 TaxID=3041267 RepID=UPI00280CF535|nr:metallophosphoesterase [Pelagicoccus sp. SDUM812003]MDQ8201810.1 metallophosphoesterase [Pelagicoccus sp. SDUM812003]